MYSARLFANANYGGISDPAKRGLFSTYFRAYSQPIYDAREATGTIRVYRASFGFQGSLGAGASIPWNDTWSPPTGNDATMLIVDPSTGREWDLWLVNLANKSACVTWENVAAGFVVTERNLCVGQADLVQDVAGNPADYRSYSGGYPTGGSHLPGLAMIVTADEVTTGVIPHALNAVVYNTMFGPECTAMQRSTTAAGTTCGFYENPASRLEWASAPQDCGGYTQENSTAGRSKTVPEGMRFAIHITDAQIEQWLNSRGYAGALRNTARIFAVAARDYGFIVTNTSCWDSGFVTDGMFNSTTRSKWLALGVPDDNSLSLLHGLFTQDELWAVAPSEALSVGSATPAGP